MLKGYEVFKVETNHIKDGRSIRIIQSPARDGNILMMIHRRLQSIISLAKQVAVIRHGAQGI